MSVLPKKKKQLPVVYYWRLFKEEYSHFYLGYAYVGVVLQLMKRTEHHMEMPVTAFCSEPPWCFTKRARGAGLARPLWCLVWSPTCLVIDENQALASSRWRAGCRRRRHGLWRSNLKTRRQGGAYCVPDIGESRTVGSQWCSLRANHPVILADLLTGKAPVN